MATAHEKTIDTRRRGCNGYLPSLYSLPIQLYALLAALTHLTLKSFRTSYFQCLISKRKTASQNNNKKEYCQRQSTFFMMEISGISIIIFILNKIKRCKIVLFGRFILSFLYLAAVNSFIWFFEILPE